MKNNSTVSVSLIQPKPVVPVVRIILDLSMEDAECFNRMTDFIGGLPELSARGVIDQLRKEFLRLNIGKNMNAVEDVNNARISFSCRNRL